MRSPRSRRPDSSLAVYFCDLDDFKDVNDSLGHEGGDELLVALPSRLREALRAGDTVARFGGDEFVILCEDLDSEAEAIRIAERIAEAFALPFELDERQHHLSVSVGIVFVKGGQASAPEVLRDADAAMYRAKGSGKGRVRGVRRADARVARRAAADRGGPAPRARRGRAARALPAGALARARRVRRRRGARALGAPRARAAGAGGVHRDRRGQRADRPARRVGARARPAGRPRLESWDRGRRGPLGLGQPLAPPALALGRTRAARRGR